MNLVRSTSTTLAGDATSAYLQLREQADRTALANLSALYSIAVDDHDLDTVVDCFATDGTFTRLGVVQRGHDDLRRFYATMMDLYVTTLHVPNTQVVDVDTAAGRATGLVTGHAELALEGRLLCAAYRYDDEYTRIDNRWVFQAREIGFMYNMPIEEMAIGFADDQRLRVPGRPIAAGDYPETLPTWNTYR